MPAILGVLISALPALLGQLGRALSGASGLAVAAITALPALIEAVGNFLDKVAKSPLLSFLFGGLVIGSAAFFYGMSMDAPLRAKHKRDAINGANRQAEIAIAKVQSEADALLAKYKARIAELERHAANPAPKSKR